MPWPQSLDQQQQQQVQYWLQGFLFTQISGHSPIKILKILNISKLQDNFHIYLCEFHMPFMRMRSKCPVTKFGQQKPWALKEKHVLVFHE